MTPQGSRRIGQFRAGDEMGPRRRRPRPEAERAIDVDLDGTPAWTTPLTAHPTTRDWGTGASAAFYRDRLFVLNDNEKQSFVAAFDTRTGRELWRTPRSGQPARKAGWSTPFVWEDGTRTELVTLGPGVAISYSLDGAERWRMHRMGAGDLGSTLPPGSGRGPDVEYDLRANLRDEPAGIIAPPVMSLTPGTHVGPYEVISALGAGGMGEVYRARDTRLDRNVALKILPESFAADPDRLMRFEREAKTLAALNHPNIAAIYGIEAASSTAPGHSSGRALVMELVEGEDLSARLTRGSLPLDEAIQITRQVADALEAAHEAGIVHRDLKPANIKVRADGTAKVLDFGLAKAIDPGGDRTVRSGGSAGSGGSLSTEANSPTMTSPAVTAMGMVLGTAAYMSPEQARGRAADRRADIWAFGVVLYEMLAGRPLFQADSVGEVLADVLRKDIDLAGLPHGTPVMLRRLIERCLDRDPRTRLQHIGEARIALTRAATDEVGSAGTTVPAPALPLWRQPAVWMLTAAVAVLAGGLALWLAKPASAPSRPVTRFAVALPEGADFINPTSREIAVSPAGSAVAFEWNQQLWIRRFEERQPVVLVPGVVDVREPFFSPDGGHIGFFSNEKMMRVASSGGPPEVIGGPIPGRPLGVSWADDGNIYVGLDGNIARLSATGGVPETIIEVQPGERASSPQLLPGGTWLLYTLLTDAADWDEAQIVAESLQTQERRVLVKSGRAGRVTPTGHLLYVFGGVLYGRAFDARAVAVTGGPVPLVGDVRSAAANYTGAAFFDLSPRGDLIYLEGATGTFSPTRLAWLDRAGRETPLPFDPQPYAQVRLSPDDRRIAAAVRHSGQQSDVWMYEVDRPGGQRLTSTGRADSPVWSADGQWIYYQSFDPGNPDLSGVARRRADLSGSAEPVLATSEILPWSISADGQRLAAHLLKPQTVTLALISLAAPPQLQEVSTAGLARNPSLSPDGRFVAFEADNGGDFSVYVMEIETRRSQMISAGVGLSPVWSKSGDEIFFWSDADMKSVRVVSADSLAFTTPVTLFTRPAHRNEFDVTRDGQRFLHIVRDRQADAPVHLEIQVVLNWFEELRAKVPVS